MTEKICIWFEQQTFQQKKKKHVQHVEVVEEKEILVGEELVTTLIEESIPIKLEVPNLAVPYFEDNKNMEDEVISFQTKKVKIFSPISEFNNVQDLRTNLLQERENDVIPRAKEQRRFIEPIPNSRVQDFNKEFHGLNKAEWKKYKARAKSDARRKPNHEAKGGANKGKLIHVILSSLSYLFVIFVVKNNR